MKDTRDTKPELPYEDQGEIEIAEADDTNVPVNIWLQKNDESPWWNLTASNYMPRKGYISDGAFDATGERDALAAVVRDVWLPLYRAAVASLEEMVSDPAGGSLYYWEHVSAKEPQP